MTRRRSEDDPIGDYVEWTQHRYTPGYYTGGRIPPMLRPDRMRPGVRKFYGALILIFVGISGLEMLTWLRDSTDVSNVVAVPITIGVGALYAAVGWTFYKWQPAQPPPKHKHRDYH